MPILGDGHYVYGPANPGEWVEVSISVMESDLSDTANRELFAELVRAVANTRRLKPLLTIHPALGFVGKALEEIAESAARYLSKGADDTLLHTSGVFLRDSHDGPFRIGAPQTVSNASVEFELNVIPLPAANTSPPRPIAVHL